MRHTGKYVIFREGTNEFLHGSLAGHDVELTGWYPHPQAACRYDSCKDAERTAQELASRQGCKLTVCELAESETKIALVNSVEVWPLGSPRSI